MGLNELALQRINRVKFGQIAVAFNRELERIAADCDDRPADKTKRKVNLQVGMIPVMDPVDGTLDSVTVDFQIKSTIPVRQSNEFNMAVRRLAGGKTQVLFNDFCEDDVHQRSLDETYPAFTDNDDSDIEGSSDELAE